MKRDRDEVQEGASVDRQKKIKMHTKREHQAGEEAKPARNKKKLFCLSLVARTACHSHQQQEIIEQIEEHNPLFVVAGSNQPFVMKFMS